ncbi:MAG: AbrB/MazE/SpoVT family DNA-binding domain-containing protein [Anaeroplasmataceae bacterium]
MKETGVIRRIDELGRIVVPKEIRRRLKITTGDQIDISINGNNIILNKYEPLEDNISKIKILVNSMSEICNFSISIFDNYKCIISTNEFISEGDIVLDNLLHKIKDNDLELNNTTSEGITDDYINDKYTYITKIICNYEFMGFIIISKNSIILKSDIENTNILKEFIVKLNEYN